MLKNKALLIPFIVILGLVFIFLRDQPAQNIHLQGATMGTTYNVKWPENATVNPAEIQTEIDALLVEINHLMSTYDPNSELSRFNQLDSTQWFELSPETAVVVKEALRLGEMSNSVLDITVGPLVNLWGFGPQATPETIPSEQQIEDVGAYVGLDKIELDDTKIRKLHPDVYVDLSTIAKGYGVDQVAELLEQKGIDSYLVEIGGEMRVAGNKANGQPWRIAVERPVSTERAVQAILSVGDNAIATSGDYRNYYVKDGVRYSHLIDPRTGKPIQHNLVAVTVIHPSSMTADGLATALIVMGKDQALNVAHQNGLDVLLITRENNQFKEYTSGKFEQYLVTQ